MITKIDAKIIAMIDDMSRGALLEAVELDNDQVGDTSTVAIRTNVRELYEAGTLTEEDIILAWELDGN